MSDQEDEVEFTDNEVNDLNVLLQSMTDAHCKEFGHFRLLQSLSCDEDVRVTSKYGMGKQTLSLLRRISATNEVLKLDFERAFDESYWPDHEEIPNNYDSDGEDYNDWESINVLQTNQDKYDATRGFIRGRDRKHFLQIARGKTNPGRGIYGLGCFLHSIPHPQQRLVSLNIACNDITCEDVIIACDAFKGLRNLAELDMSNNNIRAEGAIAIFTTLLGHPSCNIQKLNLSHNRLRNNPCYYSMKKERDPGQALVDVLQHTNRSLVELNLQDTYIGASYSMVYIFVCPLLLDSNNDILKYAEERNHCLKELQIDDNRSIDEGGEMRIRSELQHVISFNKDGPQQALAEKLYIHFETDENKKFLFKLRQKKS